MVVTFGYAALPLKRAVATMLFIDRSGRVLVVKPTYKPGWELPGGSVEDGESPATAATREVDEELGLRYLPALQARRAVASLRARMSGQAVYLEDGLPLAT
jgi:8-oxo-dGTP pyrophosphatase MutT (NUDIX family)